MTAALYALGAAIIATLATRAWLVDKDAPGRKAFMGMGWSLALTYLLFALSFLPNMSVLRPMFTVTGSLVPAYFFACTTALFSSSERDTVLAKRLISLSWLWGPTVVTLHFLYWPDSYRSSPPEILTGVAAGGVLLLALWRIYQAREAVSLPVQRTRITWLLRLSVIAIVLTGIEWFVRNTQPEVDRGSLAFLERGLALQGAIPPVSALCTSAVAYFLYHSMLQYRIVALRQLLSRLSVVLVSAGVLLFAFAIALKWVAITRFPLHSGFTLFLVSALFLSSYDTLRSPLRKLTSRWINPNSQALDEATDLLLHELPSVLGAQMLSDTLVDRIYNSGRVREVGVYLFDPAFGACRLMSHRSELGHQDAESPLEIIALHPFAEAFSPDIRWLSTQPGTRPQNRASDSQRSLMRTMPAELCLAISSRRTVLGWISIRDIEGSDGFIAEEIQAFNAVTDLTGRLLANIEDFKQLQEQRHLAMLGTMSAGLAHEIRNPLAGLKGAAQYLEGEPLNEDAREMLEVIVEETTRLNTVVTQFLNYARPFALKLAEHDLNSLIERTMNLLKVEGLPEDIEIVFEPAQDLHLSMLDADRVVQVLLNLMQNALQALEGSGRLSIHTANRRLPGGEYAVEVQITDDGPGIRSEDQEQIFTPFFTTRPRGTGLGLPLSRRMVDAHGGTLTVRSTPGHGASFTVTLPVQRSRQPSTPVGTPSESSTSGSTSITGSMSSTGSSAKGSSSTSATGTGPIPGTALEESTGRLST